MPLSINNHLEFPGNKCESRIKIREKLSQWSGTGWSRTLQSPRCAALAHQGGGVGGSYPGEEPTKSFYLYKNKPQGRLADNSLGILELEKNVINGLISTPHRGRGLTDK